MGNFQTAQVRAKKLTPQKISKDFFNFIRKIERELAQYNKAKIFIDSEDIFGEPIGFYSPATESITNGRKKAGDPFTLFDEGDFLGGLFAEVRGQSIHFDTKDPKKNEVLKNTLTSDIFGLQDGDLKKAIDERILPFLLVYYKKNLIG
jgi:hypothetical protein